MAVAGVLILLLLLNRALYINEKCYPSGDPQRAPLNSGTPVWTHNGLNHGLVQ